MDIKEHRAHPRYRIHWHACVIVDVGDEKTVHHGNIYDISLAGASFYSILNLFVKEPVTILLNIPKGKEKSSWITIEVKCRMVYTVLSSRHDKFRIGLHFLSFKGGQKKVLEDALKFHVPMSRAK